MSEAIARTALNKGRYFLDQAKTHEFTGGLPFRANLEAAIIYGRSVLDHLDYEYKNGQRAVYEPWKNTQWNALMTTPLFAWLQSERNIIVHLEPTKTSTVMFAEAALFVFSGMSVQLRIERADGTIEVDNGPQPIQQPQPITASPSQPRPNEMRFKQPGFEEKRAVEYVADFLDLVEPVVTDAEKRFS